MKPNKTITFFIFLFSFFIWSCDDGNNSTTTEQPKDQTATLTNLFGEGFTAAVQGRLTDTQWNGVASKIETALNGAFEANRTSIKDAFRYVFRDDVVIIVEKTTQYGKYKVVDGAFRTLYLNVDYVSGSSNADLQETITSAAVYAMGFETPATE